MDLRDLLTKPWRLQRGFDRLIEPERDLSRGKDLEGEVSRLYERLEEMATSGPVRRISPSMTSSRGRNLESNLWS